MCGPVGHPAWIIIVFLWPSNNQDCRVFVSLSLSLFYLSFFPTLVLGSLAYLLVFIYLLLLLLLLLDWLVIMCLLGID